MNKNAQIDLRLAVNYVPACSCIFRLLVYLYLRDALVGALDTDHLYVFLGMLLYLDRVVQGEFLFFDGNSLLFSVFFADFYQHVRETPHDIHFAVFLVYFFWGLFSVAAITDLGSKTWRAPLGIDLANIYAVLVLVVLFFLLFYPMQSEPTGCRQGKAAAFVLITTVWVYLTNLENAYCKKTYHLYFLTRFLPILILPMWMSIVVFVMALTAVAWRFWTYIPFQIGAETPKTEYREVELAWNAPAEPEPVKLAEVKPAVEMEDLQATLDMFRLAKEAAQKPKSSV